MRHDRTYNSSSWTKEEDKAFENTLADYYGNSNVFRNIAAAVPQKSNQEILDHFNALLEDISDIESGIVPLPKYRRNRSSVARRKGIPWTSEEHRLFLQGLAKHGKGDWRGISRNFVLSRTPTQVASHAQKFFRRLKDNDNGRRRRSIHDITSAADITEPSSHGQESDELKGPCGGQSSVNPEKFPLGAALCSSDLNSSFPGVDEFLESIKDQITAPAEGPSGVYHGVDTRTSRSLSLQPSVAGGTGMYTHPVSFADEDEFQPDVDDRITVPAKGTSRRVETRTFASHSLQPSVAAGGTGMYSHPVINVRYDLEELMTGSSQVGGPSVNNASLPLPIADHIGVHNCTASSSGTKNGALEGVFPSVPVSSGVETYPCWYPSSKDENMFDLDDQFPHHIFGFGK